MSRKRAQQKYPGQSPKKPVKKWDLIVIDQEPIRKSAATECSRAMAQLEKARAEWRRFDREDRPAFERWVAATFGEMLTNIRELAAQVSEKEMLVAEVEMELMFGGRGGYGAAYQRVMEQRASPRRPAPGSNEEPPPQEEGEWPGEDPHSGADDYEFDPMEEELMFEHFARMVMGINPDRLSAREYDRLLKEFRENVLRKDTERQQAPPPPPHGSEFGAVRSGEVKSESGRVKELYRLLVRRLHPDMKADKDAEVSHFWHDVQEAYAQGNVERLEMLLALTDLQSSEFGGHTSLFQMRAVLKELRSALRALQRSLGQAKKDPAWKFAVLTNRQQIRAGIQRRLEKELRDHRANLAELEQQIARWKAAASRAKPAGRKNPPPPGERRKKGGGSRYTQTGFPF